MEKAKTSKRLRPTPRKIVPWDETEDEIKRGGAAITKPASPK